MRQVVLPGSSASRGAIRAGQFSQLAIVIQAGSEDGVWTFDRYDRWIVPVRSAASIATWTWSTVVTPVWQLPLNSADSEQVTFVMAKTA